MDLPIQSGMTETMVASRLPENDFIKLRCWSFRTKKNRFSKLSKKTWFLGGETWQFRFVCLCIASKSSQYIKIIKYRLICNTGSRFCLAKFRFWSDSRIWVFCFFLGLPVGWSIVDYIKGSLLFESFLAVTWLTVYRQLTVSNAQKCFWECFGDVLEHFGNALCMF